MKSVLMFTALFLATILHSQTILTVGEIFDYNINDEFHTVNDYPPGPPNAIRMKVIAKHFSAANDTVFYTRSFNNYYSVFNPYPTPHLDYYFDIYVDSVFYTNLTDSILCNSMDTSCVSIVDTTICGVPTNGVSYLWLEIYNATIYGKGLGVVRDVYVENGSPDQSYDYKIFYFKKDTIECGIPDLITSVSSNIASDGFATVYPNPFTDKFNIRFEDDNHSYRIKIFDLKGQEIFETKVNGCSSVVIDKIMYKGLYILIMETEDKSFQTKIVKR